MFKSRKILIVFCIFGFLATARAYDRGRQVKIVWDFDKNELSVFLNVSPSPVKLPFTFILRPDDRVILEIQTTNNSDLYSIGYKIVAPESSYELPGEIGGILTGEKKSPEEPLQQAAPDSQIILPVSKKLIASGELKVSFIKKRSGTAVRENEKNKRACAKSESEKPKPENENTKPEKQVDIYFKVKSGYPFFIPSTGVVLTNETNPEIAIIQDAAGQSVLAYKNKSAVSPFYKHLKPTEDIIQFFNFRLYEGLYLIFGFPLTLSKKVYENPHFGFAFYPGQDLPLLLTAGISFHKELEILGSSGYIENQPLEKDTKLEMIPTESKSHARFYVGIAFRLK